MKFNELIEILESSSLIYLNEIATSKKHIQLFKNKYKVNIADDEIIKIFNRFNTQQSRLQNKDIFNYKSIEDLLNAIEEKSGKELEKNIRKDEANIIINNDRVMVVEPLTVNASKKYGSNTKWCTTSNNDILNGFDYWSRTYSLVYLIDKINNKKYAIAFNPYLNEEGWDEKDNDLGVDKILDILDLSFEEIFDNVVPKEYPTEP